MFVLGVLHEAGQHFSPGRAVELGDVIANGIGVARGALLALTIHTQIAKMWMNSVDFLIGYTFVPGSVQRAKIAVVHRSREGAL